MQLRNLEKEGGQSENDYIIIIIVSHKHIDTLTHKQALIIPCTKRIK